MREVCIYGSLCTNVCGRGRLTIRDSEETRPTDNTVLSASIPHEAASIERERERERETELTAVV
jgi:hypothetical protein